MKPQSKVGAPMPIMCAGIATLKKLHVSFNRRRSIAIA
jgi:hypothetical protein